MLTENFQQLIDNNKTLVWVTDPTNKTTCHWLLKYN